MGFEWDPEKSEANKAKHGIDFAEAQTLWDGTTVEVPAKIIGDEVRVAVIGAIKGKVWIAIVTLRGENIRIISCRRAQPKEEKLYGKI